MKIIKQHVHGKLFSGDGRNALFLINANPETETAESLYLCFALTVQGPEDHILPAVVKDDWGNERRDLSVYTWLEDEGHLFPRSELFGYDPDGTETQCFLRAIELYARLPCYVFLAKAAPVMDGFLLDAVLLPDDSVNAPQKTTRPSQLVRPFANAAVNWWLVPPSTTHFP
jgi:hypothetical protein